jgi:hypothetical protein
MKKALLAAIVLTALAAEFVFCGNVIVGLLSFKLSLLIAIVSHSPT